MTNLATTNDVSIIGVGMTPVAEHWGFGLTRIGAASH